MRLPSAACLLGRHNILLSQASSLQRIASLPFRPASSLSAIHNGLRQSEKARPQGFKPADLATDRPPRTSRGPRHTRPNPRDPDWTPPGFKLKRGKKDVTDRGPQRQSRRARFNDPTSSFGKRSMVYQMKHGNLRNQLRELRDERSKVNQQSVGTLTSEDFMKDFNGAEAGSSRAGRGDRDRGSRTGSSLRESGRFADRRSTSTRNGPQESKRFGASRSTYSRNSPQEERFGDRRSTRNSAQDSDSFRDHGDKGFRRQRDLPQTGFTSNRGSFDRRPRDALEDRPRRDSRSRFPASNEGLSDRRMESGSAPSQPSESYPRDRPAWDKPNDSDNNPDRDGSRADHGPVRVHHTTAASQFLYGRSVVEAALKDSRRQLYRLYIYDGEDRRNVSQDVALEKLADRKSVKVVRVARGDLRMMDKMSGGRPHNGCVLEASPLPQLPLKSLGALSEDETKPGFHVEVTHQSAEEAKVNGTSDFVSFQLPQGRNPFVLLLDGILDPGNLGAILRSAAFLGVNAVAITKGSSSTMTAVALKASAGASEVMTLFSVSSTLDFLNRSKESGWMVYAAVPGTTRSRGNSHLTLDRVETYDPLSSQPTILVVGSEGEGLTKPVRRAADHEVSIPSPPGGFTNVVDSLNVSVATGILCSSFLKKQSSGMIEIEERRAESDEGEEGEQLW
ncbi:RNA methyltransferase [Xylariaceae sp. FL0255]|nr:RNA methyltransferase [Xylariaceae sp. FL0255]